MPGDANSRWPERSLRRNYFDAEGLTDEKKPALCTYGRKVFQTAGTVKACLGEFEEEEEWRKCNE